MSHTVRFDQFEVDLSAGQLYKRGLKINLREKSFQVLEALLERAGQVVTREELQQRLWQQEVFVDFENNLNTAVARLREALCDSADHPRFVETLPKRGYRFLAGISELREAQKSGAPHRSRLLVLPFLNPSGDAAQEYFSDAMTDEIITALAALAPEHLAVIARTTAMHYKGSHKDVARIGRELNVDYVVEGAVRREGELVSLNVQLIQTGEQTHLFARRYDTEMRDIFSLHGCIAQAIARHVPAIADALRHGRKVLEGVRRKPTEDLVAYNEYIKGRYEMWKMTAESLAEAKRHFETAVARDQALALACNALAELYYYLGLWGYLPSAETDQMGRSYALRAMNIDSSSAETHVLLSFFSGKREGGDEIDPYNWAEIQKNLARACELDPTLRMVRLRRAQVHAILGHTDEGVAELEQALESDPLSLDIRAWLVIMFHLGHRFERALEEALKLRDLEPEHFLPYHLLGIVYLGLQRFDDSVAALRRAIEFSKELPMDLGFLGLALSLGGHVLEARAVLDRLRSLAAERYVAPTCFAWIQLGLGNIDDAFLWLERAVDAPDRMIEPIKTWPILDPVRSDPRFAALLRKMNLEP